MTEIWKDIDGYNRQYQVSNFGQIRSCTKIFFKDNCIVRKWKIIQPSLTKRGYLKINLHKNGKSKTFLVHRLVAEAFIPNPNNLPFINHKSEVKTENFADNLEWCDAKYNVNYGTGRERRLSSLYERKVFRPIIAFDGIHKLGIYFPSVKEAGIYLTGKKATGISACLNQKQNIAYGYKWEYA